MPLLLCDLDDTLVDRQGAFRRWAESFAAARGLDGAFVDWVVEEDDHGYRPRRQLFEAIRARTGVGHSVDALISAYRQEFNALFRCAPDVAAALRTVRRAGWKIAIVTNGSSYQLDKIAAADLTALVDACCISALEGFAKPDPRLLEAAARRCRRPLEGAWLVGDHPGNDIGAAVAAGISSVWLHHGRTWEHPLYAPTHEAEHFPAAAAIVLAEAAPG